MGSAEGLSPFAGRLRVSLRYKVLPFPHSKGASDGWPKEVFSALPGDYPNSSAIRSPTILSSPSYSPKTWSAT